MERAMSERKPSKHRKKDRNALTRRGIIRRAMENYRSTRKSLLAHDPDFFKEADFFGAIKRHEPDVQVHIDVDKNRKTVEKFIDQVPAHSAELKTKVKAMLEQQENSIH